MSNSIHQMIDSTVTNKQFSNELQITIIDKIAFAVTGLIFGAGMSIIAKELNADIHGLYQPLIFALAIPVSYIIVLPAFEELLKVIAIRLTSKLNNESVNLLFILSVAYGFQIMEAYFFSTYHEPQWWLRFILPMHVCFTLAIYRYNYFIGWILHGLWNTQIYFPDSELFFYVFYLLYYLFFILFLEGWNNNKLEKEAMRIARNELLTTTFKDTLE